MAMYLATFVPIPARGQSVQLFEIYICFSQKTACRHRESGLPVDILYRL